MVETQRAASGPAIIYKLFSTQELHFQEFWEIWIKPGVKVIANKRFKMYRRWDWLVISIFKDVLSTEGIKWGRELNLNGK